MHLWQKTLQAAFQMGTELVDREWSSLGEWQQQSAVQGPLFLQVCEWLEAFADKPLFQHGQQQREAQLLLGRQMREELAVLCAALQPVQALALLCHLPSSREFGYTKERLATALQVTEAELQVWERQAYERTGELVKGSERLPLLLFLAGKVEPMAVEPEDCVDLGDKQSVQGQLQEQIQEQPQKQLQEQEKEALLHQAGQSADFDLRLYLPPAKELAIRQSLHLHGLTARELVQALFAEEDAFAVDLVAERMKLEMQGKEETTDANA